MRRILEVIAPARLGRAFRWLLASAWLGNLADGIDLAAGPLLVASQTHNAVLVALALMLQRLPWLLFGLLAGVAADRFDRRRLIVTIGLCRAAVLSALTITVLLDRVDILLVLVAMFLLGTADTFADTTAATLLPTILDRDDVGIGNARLMAGIVTINQLAGPPLGAALFATGRAVPFLVQTVCVLASAAAATRLSLPLRTAAPRAARRIRHDIAEGVRWLWASPPVRTLTITIVTFNVTFGAAWSVLVLYAKERLHTGDIGFGIFTAASAVGGLVGTAVYARLTARVRLGDIMRVGLIVETATHLSLALTTRYGIALVIMLCFGAHASIWGTTATTVRQRAVPLELQGRVSSVYLIGVQGGIVAGAAVGGVIAGAWGVTAPFWFAFVGSAILVGLLWPQLTRIAHSDDRSPATS